ncbi:MAG TPA: zinc ABC transporter substrate-binding protein, partial [Armatimonadaceae bacterium]|nr:zinc ABC transporter substrate-binding protein [Armatimonadaceae bacterium]
MMTNRRSALPRLLILLLTLVFAPLLAGCPGAAPDGGKVRVATTTGMIADIVRNVGGDRVDVTALMGPGTDPHYYKATAGD